MNAELAVGNQLLNKKISIHLIGIAFRGTRSGRKMWIEWEYPHPRKKIKLQSKPHITATLP